jgi:glutamate carboxypeptidase
MNRSPLDWIDTQGEAMVRLLETWSAINSESHNIPGLARMAAALELEFDSIGGVRRTVDLRGQDSIDSTGKSATLPLGKAISIVKRSEAAKRVFLNIHYDTVYPPEHPFQRTTRVDPNTLRGPGVLDAKGGLVVLLTAVRALEQSPLADQIGLEILLNPDEEIGSPGSAPLFIEAAKRNHLGLLFEPAMPDGSLVGPRKGSGNFTVVVRGRASHAGRDFDAGRSAIYALGQFIAAIESAQPALKPVTLNCGRIEGGGPLNVVPDLAIGRFNARVNTDAEQKAVEDLFSRTTAEIARRDGIVIAIHGGFHAPPKPLDPRSGALLDHIIAAGRELGLSLNWKASGGASDGNKLAAAGLPVIDSLGPQGADLHSDREFVRIDSLVERAKLTALVLLRIAEGRIAIL